MDRCAANYIALTPIAFLERAAFVYADRDAIIYGNNISRRRFSWKQTHQRCINLASALSHLGIGRRDIVAAMAPNIPPLYELNFGVPMTGAVLSALNTKLDSPTLSLKLALLEPKAIFVDYEYVEVVVESLDLAKLSPPPLLILILEDNKIVKNGESGFKIHDKFLENGTSNFKNHNKFLENGHSELKIYDKLLKMKGFHFKIYNEFLETGNSDFKIVYPDDECDPIAINFTSGSTGNPKGAVYSHRATYLNTIAQIFRSEMAGKSPVFLWTVDMFRCNGWCLPWTMAALGGTNICSRDSSGQAILDAISRHNVTHLCGQPLILTKIADAIDNNTNVELPPNKVDVIVAGVLPPSEILSKLEAKGFNISYAYGMTEALGPVTSIPWNSRENINSRPTTLTDDEKLRRLREGMHNIMVEGADVKDPVTMQSVPADGETTGEIMFRSNTMMLGYFKNKQGTQEAFEGGWYRTRDIGVKHPSGYIELKDRRADVIKRGTEIISSLEIESVLVRHPMVLEAAVVAVGKPDEVLGQTACAFVKFKEGRRATEEDIIKFCEDNLPHHMVPQAVIFGDLPLNSTGKIQKFALREKAKCLCKTLNNGKQNHF
ncbi:PREDICTED: probable acyl-activating enzyme 1, peroxisomal [Ipomoea nil]|uniref:probable acyl-activating enzyme 1, peroxisomal n=1 Tax=Ipomoea nil TaxID=35883 RepID=UPI0009015741|nr:PREDICTED: probable acyl-activating enzyme 1, peroxisomal [Ipomoea nil]